MQIALGVLDVKKARELGLRCIPEEGTFLEPGETVFMSVDDRPLIFATANKEVMMVAHTEDAGVVGTIVLAFRSRGVLPFDIKMEVQTYEQKYEFEFVEEARNAGIRHVWASASHPISAYMADPDVDATIDGKNFVTIRRDN